MLSAPETERRRERARSAATLPEGWRVSADFGPCQHPGCRRPERVIGVDARDGRTYLSSNCATHAVRDA